MINSPIKGFLGILLLTAFVSLDANSQSLQQTSRFEFINQSNLLFSPLIASHQEARVGFVMFADENALRGDIGTSVDIASMRCDTTAASPVLAIGADFFTWTRLRRTENFHFPVDAVDYLFGVNMSYKKPLNEAVTVSGRLRLSHISAHLADGRYDKTEQHWIDNRMAQIYSREFLDLVLALSWGDAVRVYAGGQYIYHVKPLTVGRTELQAGCEGALTNLSGNWLHAYFAYDLKLFSVTPTTFHSVSASNSIQAGVKFGRFRGRGINVFLAWYNGMSQEGEFYEKRQTYFGLGMIVDV
jgi:hypothetical protein